MNYVLPKIPLTPSQKKSLVALAVVAVSAGYDALSKLSNNPLFHPSPIVAALLPLTLIIAGSVKTALYRSLDKSRSGTGSGLVGSAPDKAAEATQGGLLPGTAEEKGLGQAEPPTVTVVGPSPQEIAAAVQPLLAAGLEASVAKLNAEKTVVKNPALSEVLDLLLTNALALNPARQLALLATAGTHLTEQSGETAQTLMGAKKANSAALMAGIAQKADEGQAAGNPAEVKADTPQEGAEPQDEPKQPGVIAQVVSAILGKPEDKTASEDKAAQGDPAAADTMPPVLVPFAVPAPAPAGISAASQE